MDHSEAVRMQAAAKYVLGELPQGLRDEYEEHYFDCAECALDVRAAAVFTDNARNVLCQVEREASLKAAAPVGSRWLAWLRPVVAVPAMLILLAIVGYQSLIMLPHLKSASSAGKAQVFNSFSLVAANVRGERGDEAVKVQVHKNEVFALDFDFLPKPRFDHYLCQLQDEAGRAVLQVAIPPEKEKGEVHLLVPKGLDRGGNYNVVVVGDAEGKGQWVKGNEVLRLDFVVEILP